MADRRNRATGAGVQTRSSKTSNSATAAGFLSSANASSRAVALLGLFTLLACIFLIRLIYLQVVVAEDYSSRAKEARTLIIDSSPRRGTIYDRNGVVLAKSIDATTVYVNPSEVTNVDYEAAQLASVLGGTMADYQEALSEDETSFVYIKRQVEVELAEKLKELELGGIYFTPDTKRVYPNAQTGAQVVGLVDPDGNGTSGLELYYDDILRGSPGTLVMERGASGIPIPGGIHEETPTVNGQDIIISLDIGMQQHLEEVLAKGVSDLAGKGGNSVMMDAGTGEIFAIASLPYFDPSNRSEIAEGATQLRSITDAFEPGSIFKTVSVNAILENKVMTPEDEIFCPAVLPADEYYVSDAHDRGDQTMTLRQILDKSSNVGISLASEKLGFDKFYQKILDYNLTEATGVDYPGESGGYLLEQANWSLIQSYNVSFGQGVAVTPLQMTRYYGTLANNGLESIPHFLIKKLNTEDQPVYKDESLIVDDEALATLSNMLETVVSDGTGTPAAIEGYTVAGKTGTAEIANPDGGYLRGVYNISFIGYLPNSSSQLVCFVGATEVPGDRTVAPIFKDIMTFAIDRYKVVPSEG